MKKQFLSASAMIVQRIACTASASRLNRFVLLAAVGCLLFFSSCARNVGSGCGTWTYKVKNNYDRKTTNNMARMYKTKPGTYYHLNTVSKR